MLTEKVIDLLDKSDLPATLTIEQCASSLAMSMTSFRRKLSQEETSYKLIHSKYLNELCIKALLTNQVNIEDLVIKLGYSERATFERAFRNKFGITPSKFRNLSLIGHDKNSQFNLAKIAKNMPPLPASCQKLLHERYQNSLDLQCVTDIVEKDPIYSARVMGLASKAIYGKTPKNIQEAIGRNLGINTVVNLAIVYAVKDMLQAYVNPLIIDKFTQAFLIAPKVFQIIRKSPEINIKFDIAITEQVLTFSLLGVFLLAHKSSYKHEFMFHSLEGIDDLSTLNKHIYQSMDISLFSASSVMLSLWHIDVSLIKELNALDKFSKEGGLAHKKDELIFFMLSCLYAYASGCNDISDLEQKAEILNITNFAQVRNLLYKAN